jgi:NADH-ubiquinone oxidoreductase chain 5
LTVSLGLAVIFCSTLIHIYSIYYLPSDPHNQRFFSYLSAFTFGMLVLITGANFFVMFVGWEIIGLVSYLLINFYFTRVQANKAAILAFTMNRQGDMLLSIGFMAIFALFGSLNYSTVFSLAPYMNETALTIIALLLFGGACAKSAQLPLHSWLPGSMEAPTPVSALLHAATLVTAGIYLLLRCSPILEYSPTALLVITIVGSSTAFFAATCGLVTNDLKRIIAMSTISQLGYMVMAIGLSQYNVALFHTVNHAFFKALLFLGAGAVIHSFGDQQDIRKMGGLIKFLPFTYSVMLVGTLSLLATPFLTGFYSKDLIIELAYGNYSFSKMYAFILGSITAGLTAFYSFRLISLVFLVSPNGNKQSYLNSHESNLAAIIPLITLSLFSIFFGYLFSDMFVGMGSDFFGNSVFIHPNNITLVEAEYSLSLLIKLLPSILSLLGASSALILYLTWPEIILSLTETSTGKKIYTFLNSKYYFDLIYNNYVFSNGFKLGYSISKLIDRGVIELVGPFGLSNSIFKLAKDISKLDSGVITTYALYITIGFIFFLCILFSYLLLNQNINESICLIIILSYSIFSLSFKKTQENTDSVNTITPLKFQD